MLPKKEAILTTNKINNLEIKKRSAETEQLVDYGVPLKITFQENTPIYLKRYTYIG